MTNINLFSTACLVFPVIDMILFFPDITWSSATKIDSRAILDEVISKAGPKICEFYPYIDQKYQVVAPFKYC